MNVNNPIKPDALTLGHGLSFGDLYDRGGLVRLDGLFMHALGAADGDLRQRLESARAAPGALARLEESELIIDVAPHLEEFIARLFGIEAELEIDVSGLRNADKIFVIRRNFVQRRAAKSFTVEQAESLDGDAVTVEIERLIGRESSEWHFAVNVTEWLKDEDANADALAVAERYAAWATLTEAGQARHGKGVLFQIPRKLDFDNLVHHLETGTDAGFACHRIDKDHTRRRDGFSLTDEGADLLGALGEANYCIWCHKQGRDSCSTGLREKQPKGADGPAPFRRNPLGTLLAGCPLEEKISEFQMLKAAGHPLGAFAVTIIDNPMVAGTGHRICNDCMKACVYQKQDPVDIPQAETRVLKDVLKLPWGFEIYSLLTRWNPLNIDRPYPRDNTGKKVLVVGMGPAGFTLAHHLMNDGHLVVGIDGLKIEPLDENISGVTPTGEHIPFKPIRDVKSLQENLATRIMAGFGGVAEYGITVRWDKNFLKLIRMLLERRPQFALIGGVRFGGTITLEDAWEMGFDHVALAAGAGKPTVIDMPNNLARGVRTASDFLMALQLTGAARDDSITNLQMRLPAVVIGGGLTAIDTATEALTYYVRQVIKFGQRYQILAEEKGEKAVRAGWDEEETAIADEFLAHAQEIALAYDSARIRGELTPDLLPLLNSWGGVTIAYRKRLVDSPAYTLNHEEVEKALEEGIGFAECLSPLAVEVDEYGHARGLKLARQAVDEDGNWHSNGAVTLPARSIFMAAGTQPNTVLSREDPDHFRLDGRYFQAVDEEGKPVTPEKSTAKPDDIRVLMSGNGDGRFTSFFGDLHPSWFGNVVKAMGSAKQGYPVVSRVLESVAPASAGDGYSFLARVNADLRPVVERVVRLTPTIIEVVLRAPQAARKFQPGQFYRLQNFETIAPKADGTTLAMEGLALTGAWIDPDAGLISLIVLEMGGSSNLCRYLKPGEPVILMGPTGTPTDIPSGETVLLAGGGLGNAVLFSIGQAMRAAGSKVLYFAGYKQMNNRYKIEEIERAADTIIWCCDEAPGFEATRPQDRACQGDIVEAMHAYASGELGEQVVPFSDVDRVVAIGSDHMMAAVAAARHGVLQPFLKKHHFAIGSINSPMQCMMKEICAQCLQTHIDPHTGERSYVFSCFNQDQPLDHVDWAGLNARLRQNSIQEKLKAQWVSHCTRSLEGGV
jgi:NADPH-dependent glutamate synthase beta subunit-like oxidoreductase/NAD(P)H-flavin reductase